MKINIKDIDKKYVILLMGALALFGVTYALTNIAPLFQGTTAKINIDAQAFGNPIFDSSNTKLVPILDKNLDDSINNIIKIDFSVAGDKGNTQEKEVIYDIALVDLKLDCELLSPYLKWRLVKNGEEISEGSFDYQFDTITNGRLVLTNYQENLPKYNEEKNGYDNYTFYMWISDSCQDDLAVCNKKEIIDQTNLLNRKISGKIEVELNTGSKQRLIRSPRTTLDETTCIKA